MDKIEVGDIVSVNFNNAQLTLTHKAEVLYIPQTANDNWIFKDYWNNTIYYVSEACTVTKEAKND